LAHIIKHVETVFGTCKNPTFTADLDFIWDIVLSEIENTLVANLRAVVGDAEVIDGTMTSRVIVLYTGSNSGSGRKT